MGKYFWMNWGIRKEIRKIALILKEQRQKEEDNKRTFLCSLSKLQEQGLINFNANLCVMATKVVFPVTFKVAGDGDDFIISLAAITPPPSSLSDQQLLQLCFILFCADRRWRRTWRSGGMQTEYVCGWERAGGTGMSWMVQDFKNRIDWP